MHSVFSICLVLMVAIGNSALLPSDVNNVARFHKCCSWTFGGKQFVCQMSCDHKSTNERARCIEKKNSSYITKSSYSHTLHSGVYTMTLFLGKRVFYFRFQLNAKIISAKYLFYLYNKRFLNS